MKPCCTCKILKPFENFYKSSKTVDGYQRQCKECKKNANDPILNQLRCAKFRKNNPEKSANSSKEWRSVNPDYNKKYYVKHCKKIVANAVKYKRFRRATDPIYKLIDNIRNRHGKVLRGEASSSKGLGCNSEKFREHIQLQWTEGMSWANYGNRENEWSLDHILPITSFLKTESGLWDKLSDYNRKLIHYTNLRPMWHVENIKKGKKIL